jgi:hypothetical protein
MFNQFRFKPRSQDIEILERGKNDLFIAPAVDLSEELFFKAANLLGRMGENCRHAHGDERTF